MSPATKQDILMGIVFALGIAAFLGAIAVAIELWNYAVARLTA